MSARSFQILVALLFFVFIVGPCSLTCYDEWRTTYWLGSTDLRIEFVVTESNTGKPVSGAVIEIEPVDFRGQPTSEDVIVLNSDAAGHAATEMGERTCSGQISGLGMTNSFSVELPLVRFRASAAGFETSRWRILLSTEFRNCVKRLGDGRSVVVIPIELTPN